MQIKKVIIIDDERLARVELKNQLAGLPHIQVVAEAGNGEEGIKEINLHTPDLIFLDIHMPGLSGFDMLEELEDAPPVIFTTAYDEYAIKAFEFNALDYLLKPVQVERLKDALDKAFAKKESPENETTHKIETLFPDQVLLKDGDQLYFEKLTDILFFSSYGNYVKVHLQEKTILIHRSLNQIESRSHPDQFFRANRYSLINLHHISQVKQVKKARLSVTMTNGHSLEISERKSILFRERWGM